MLVSFDEPPGDPGKNNSDDRERWNSKYSELRDKWREPDSFLSVAFSEFIRPQFPKGGTALDFAGGAGRHAIWLAQQGWEVTLIDISDIGIEQARRNAGTAASHIHFVVDDLTQFAASQTQFDVVMVFFYLDRRVFAELQKAMRPGGLLVYKTYTLERAKVAKGPKDAAYLLETGELLRMASGLRVLHYKEVAEKATAELVAMKEA